MNKTIKVDTIVRTVLLALTMINACLAMFGKSPLPFTDDQVTEVISMAAAGIMSIITWWKNNSFTQNAIKADEYKKTLDDAGK